MSLQVAASLSTLFPEAEDFLGWCAAARRAGFRLVECPLPYSMPEEELAKALQQHGLQQILITTPPGPMEGGDLGMACLPGQELHFQEALEWAIRYALALRCPMVSLMVGVVEPECDAGAHREVLEANLRYAARRFKEERLVGLLEPLSPATLPGYFLDTYNKVVAVLDSVDSPHLRLLVDFFQMQLLCGNLTTNIKRLVPYTGHVRVSQVPHRHEPSLPGELDYKYILRTLQEAGYTGYIGAAYVPSTRRTEDSLRWVEECGLALQSGP